MAEQVLTCPECSENMSLQDRELAVGNEVRCLNCGADLFLSHSREYPDEPPVWRLESLTDFDESDG